jgi:hypothetical protein
MKTFNDFILQKDEDVDQFVKHLAQSLSFEVETEKK